MHECMYADGQRHPSQRAPGAPKRSAAQKFRLPQHPREQGLTPGSTGLLRASVFPGGCGGGRSRTERGCPEHVPLGSEIHADVRAPTRRVSLPLQSAPSDNRRAGESLAVLDGESPTIEPELSGERPYGQAHIALIAAGIARSATRCRFPNLHSCRGRRSRATLRSSRRVGR